MPETYQKEKGIRTRCRKAVEKIRDPDTVLENFRKEKGSRHNVGEPSKQ